MRSKTKDLNKFDYDLNIFQREYQMEDGSWDYQEPWFVHIYEYERGNHEEHGVPIELTSEEANSLINNDPYFQDHEPDLWYGLEGFMFDKWDAMSDRLKYIFESLPKFKEEVLF